MKKSATPSALPNFRHTGQESHILREVILTHQALLNDFSRVMGMPSSRLGILRVVAVSYPTLVGPMEIARRLGINAAAITRRLHDMEADGLITRLDSEHDARRRAVVLTDKGREIFEQLHLRNHQFEERLRAITGESDLATAVKVLAEIRTIISSFAEESDYEQSNR